MPPPSNSTPTFKTDLDLGRMPSGKLGTNNPVMAVGAFVYNVLRWIGLTGLVVSGAHQCSIRPSAGGYAR